MNKTNNSFMKKLLSLTENGSSSNKYDNSHNNNNKQQCRIPMKGLNQSSWPSSKKKW
jgi:hypothetical protein